MRNDLNQYNTLICPCCRDERQYDDFNYLSQVNKQFRNPNVSSIFEAAKSNDLKWACDKCIREKRAIKSRTDKQFCVGFTHPIFAYYDLQKTCATCGIDFVFGKTEQQYWYEELNFIVWSTPKHCVSCRQKKRKEYDQNTELSNLIRHLEKDNITQIDAIINHYLEKGKLEKAKYYYAILRKNLNYKGDENILQQLKNIKKKITDFQHP